MKKILFLIVALAALSSCTKELYNWKGYDNAVYAYTKKMDERSAENLMEIYQKMLQVPGGSRKTPPPGVCADYGYMLLGKGRTEEAIYFLEKETLLYPESKPFIDRILKRLEQ